MVCFSKYTHVFPTYQFTLVLQPATCYQIKHLYGTTSAIDNVLQYKKLAHLSILPMTQDAIASFTQLKADNFYETKLKSYCFGHLMSRTFR